MFLAATVLSEVFLDVSTQMFVCFVSRCDLVKEHTVNAASADVCCYSPRLFSFHVRLNTGRLEAAAAGARHHCRDGLWSLRSHGFDALQPSGPIKLKMERLSGFIHHRSLN